MNYKIGDTVILDNNKLFEAGENILPYVITGTFPPNFEGKSFKVITTQKEVDDFNNHKVAS